MAGIKARAPVLSQHDEHSDNESPFVTIIHQTISLMLRKIYTDKNKKMALLKSDFIDKNHTISNI